MTLPGEPRSIAPIRLLYSFPHTLGAPGIGTTAFNQVRSLARVGADVTVFCTSASTSPDGVKVVETLRLGSVRIPHRAFGTADRAYRFHDLVVARALSRSPDVEAVHTWPLAAVRTLAAARRLGVLAVREAPNSHTGYSYERMRQEAVNLGLDVPRNSSHRFRASRLATEEREYELADIVLVPSAFVESTFVDAGVPPAKLARHRYGYDPAHFAPTGRADDSGTGRGLVVAFVGRADPRKGLHYALEAWIASGAAAHGTFMVCGPIDGTYARALGPLLRHPSVRQLGFVRDVAAVMRSADLLILPSVEEGSALVTYEARACGCVVLASEAAGAVDEVGGVLTHRVGDVPTLAAQVRRLDMDRAELERLRSEAIADLGELTWDRAADRLIEVYRGHRGPEEAAGEPASGGNAR